jgi:hypothetical protein
MMFSVNAPLGTALAVLLLAPSIAAAQVYRWEDQRGTVHFTNAPDRVPESYRSQVGPLPAPPVFPGEPDPEPMAHREEPHATARAVTRIAFAPGSPIIVSARISDAGTPINLILDTGADRTIVSPQTLWKLGISTLNAPRAIIKGVTGSGQAEVVQVASLQVGEARVGPLRIVAHDADLKQADGLLGRDFLEHFTVTIDSREQVVTLSPR